MTRFALIAVAIGLVGASTGCAVRTYPRGGYYGPGYRGGYYGPRHHHVYYGPAYAPPARVYVAPVAPVAPAYAPTYAPPPATVVAPPPAVAKPPATDAPAAPVPVEM